MTVKPEAPATAGTGAMARMATASAEDRVFMLAL
jgi:hypothetical protein